MKMRALLISGVLCAAAGVMLAQNPPNAVVFVVSDPSGACATPTPLQFNTTNNDLSGCSGTPGSQTWSTIGGGGSGSPGGATNSIQYKVNGTTFGGFAMSGDCTLVVATGAITCTGGSHLTSGSAVVAQKFFGVAPPGSVAGNLPGDTFSDSTNHNNYWCNAPGGTAAPACTSVTTGGWTLLNGGGGSSAFSAITGGTNTTAAMVVGTGASVAATGSGTIAATTATALAANGTNCSTGQAPTGVDASGNAEACAAYASVVVNTTTVYYAPSSLTTCFYNGDAGTSCTPSDSNTATQAQSKATPFATLAHAQSTFGNGAFILAAAHVIFQPADTALTTITNNPLAAGGTTVTTAASFACINNDFIELEQEILQVTAGCNSSSLTVLRTQNGTTNSAHAIGTGVTYLKAGFVYVDSDVQFTGTTLGVTPYSFTEAGQNPTLTNAYPASYFDFAGNDAKQWNVVFTGASPVTSGSPANGALIRCLAVSCRFHGFAANFYEYINTSASNFEAFMGALTVEGGGASGFWDHISSAGDGGQGQQIARVMQGAQGFLGPGLIGYNAGINFTEGTASKMFTYHPAGFASYTATIDANVTTGTGTKFVFLNNVNETGQLTWWGGTSQTITCVNGVSGTGIGTVYSALAFSKIDNAQNGNFAAGASTFTISGCSGVLTYISANQKSEVYDSAGSSGNTATCDGGTCASGNHFLRQFNVNTEASAQSFQVMGSTAANICVSGSYQITPFGTMTGARCGPSLWLSGHAGAPAQAATSGNGVVDYDSAKQSVSFYQGNGTEVLPATVPAAGLTAGQLVTPTGTNGAMQSSNLSGDGTTANNLVLTFATVNAGSGSCGDATHVCQVTTNPKGLVTTQTPVAITATGSGGGTSGWSGITLSLLANATQYTAPVGGALTSTTETTVSLPAQAATTISGLTVTLSASLGAATTLAVTLEDGTATPTALTCTTASSGTTCSDITHSVNVAQGDLLSFKIVATGTVTAATPQLEIGYAVGTSGVGVTSVAQTVPPQFAVSGTPISATGTLAISFPALPNSYTMDVNSPYTQNMGIRRTGGLFPNENGVVAGFGMSATATGSVSAAAPTATAPVMSQISVASGSAVGQISPSNGHRTGRTHGIQLECMGSDTVITAVRVIPCGLTSTTLANSLALDVPGAFSMAYIVFSTTGVYTSGTDTTHYMLCTVNGTTQNCVSTGVVFDTSVHRFRLFEDVANSRWTGCVDGTCVNNATDNPASGTNLAFAAGAFGISAASGIWNFAYSQLIEDWK